LKAPKLAIVLLSYNSLELLKKFLPIIQANTPKSDDYQIVVVDNASTDNTWEFLGEQEDIRRIRIEVNKGFTNGYVESLSQIDAEYYCLISSDIEVSENWCAPIVNYMDAHPNVAACGPKIMSYDRRDEFEYAGAAGGFIDYLGYPFCRGRLVNVAEKDEGQYQDAREVFWVSGACMFVREETYHKAGGLDNNFFAHMEEIDLCWRFKLMGHEVHIYPESKVFHMGGFIIKYGSSAKVYQNHRNNLVMLLKNLPFEQLIWKIPLRMCMDVLTLLKMYFDGEFKASTGINRAHYHFLLYFRRWWKSRGDAQKLKTNPNLRGIYPKSLVWKFFVQKKTHFSDLPW
jgi:GT2 family glycosyltransferase